MNEKRLFIWLKLFVIIFFTCMFFEVNLVLAATYEFKEVPSSSPDPVELFKFNTPPSTTGTGKVIIAKFVIDSDAGNLQFELDTPLSSKYSDVAFELTGANSGNQQLLDPDIPAPDNVVASIRVRDLTNPPVGVTPEVAAPGKRIIQISIKYTNDYVFAGSEEWKIKANPPVSGSHHYWFFWEEGNGETSVEASVTRPKLIEYIEDDSGNPDVTNYAAFVDFPAIKNFIFREVHINTSDALARKESYQFINVGTQALDIVSVSPASLSGSYEAINYPGSAADTLPLAAFTGTEFKCKPTSLGVVPDVNISMPVNSLAITELNINLQDCRGIRLNSAMLLDLSGSMLQDVHGVYSYDDDGLPTNSEDERKIWHAREAGRLLKDLYHNLLPKGRFGLFSYPDLAGGCPSAGNFGGLQEIEDNHDNIDDYLNNSHTLRIAPETVYFLTPMAEGIKKVYDILARGQADNRSVTFMIGDGHHSSGCNSSPPNENPADWEAELTSSGIKFYTIPYGDNEEAWTQQLKDISTWTFGISYPVNMTDDLDLSKRHENAIRDALGLETITDPEGTIRRNIQISHSICAAREAYTLTFIVRWESNNSNMISATLLTPEGESITPQIAQSSPNDVGYFSSDSYVGYVIRGRYLEGKAGRGKWKLQIIGNQNMGSEQELRYAYSVYAHSTLETSYDFSLPHAGEIGKFKFFIGDDNHRIRNLTSTLTYRVPGNSFGTYLARKHVDPKLIFEAPDIINGNSASLADKKYYVLKNILKKPFDPNYQTGQLKLSPSIGPVRKNAVATIGNMYNATFDKTKYPGNYELVAKINGITLQGDCFEREIRAIKEVALKFTPDIIKNQIKANSFKVTPFFPPELRKILKEPIPMKYERKNIVFTPRDANGNYWGPGKTNQIKFALKNAEALGSHVDNLDGSYIQVIQHEKDATPVVTVTAGKTSATVEIKPFYTWELSGHLGYSIPQGTLSNNYDGSLSGMIDLGYRFDPKLSAELLLGYHQFDNKNVGDDFYWAHTSLNAKYSYPVQNYKAFVNGGIGWYFPETGDDALGFNIGAGFLRSINERLAVELGYNYHKVSEGDLDEFSTINLGIRYGF